MNVYKVDDDELVDQIASPYIEQRSLGWQGFLGGGIALSLGNLIYPFVEYLDMEITSFISIIIIAIIFLLIIGFFFYSNILCGKKLKQQINLEEFPKEKLWIRPESKKYFLFILYFYLLLIGLTVLFLGGSIQMPNGFMFFVGSMVLFMAIGGSLVTIKVGDTTVRFKGDSVKRE